MGAMGRAESWLSGGGPISSSQSKPLFFPGLTGESRKAHHAR
jgi:hypothetical protein